jgi:hypothetical protein
MEGGVSMKLIIILLFYFITSFLFGENTTQEIVKVNIIIKGNNYITYFILSSQENPNNFFIVGEKL